MKLLKDESEIIFAITKFMHSLVRMEDSMKFNLKHTVTCIGGTIALSVLLSVPAFAETTTTEEEQVSYVWTDKVAANVNSRANIRSDATTDSEIVGKLPRGAVATAIGEKDGWIQVTSGEVEGYIRADLLVSDEEAKAFYMSVHGTEEGNVEATAITPAPAEEAAESEEVTETEETAAAGIEVADSDLALMAAIIECEAGGESYEGKIAVGAVVINRVNSSQFPGTVTDVVYQSGQFSPVASGKLATVLARGAREDCYEAARDVFNGANTIGDKLFFSAGSGQGIQIGNQHFY